MSRKWEEEKENLDYTKRIIVNLIMIKPTKKFLETLISYLPKPTKVSFPTSGVRRPIIGLK